MQFVSDNEPIPLDDDTDDDIEPNENTDGEEEEYESISDISNELPKNTLRKRILRYNPRFYVTRMLLKKSIMNWSLPMCKQ